MMTISSNGEQIKHTTHTYIHTCMHACMNAYTTKTFRLTTFHSSFCRSLFSMQYASRCKPNICKRNRKNGKQISAKSHTQNIVQYEMYGTPGNWRAQSAATNLHDDMPTNRHSKSARERAILYCFGLVWFGWACFHFWRSKFVFPLDIFPFLLRRIFFCIFRSISFSFHIF